MAELHTVTYFDGKRLSRLVFDDCSEPTEAELISMLGGDTVELICGSPDAPESFFGYRIGRSQNMPNWTVAMFSCVPLKPTACTHAAARI